MKRLFLSLALAVGLLAGCAGGPIGQTPAQAVFAAKGTYNTALSAAVAYKRLPACSAVVKQPCSDKAVLAQLQKADNVAAAALDSAESAVRTPGFGKDAAQSAITAANAAVQALASITATLGVKP
jgi:hypothetical protein